MSLIHYGRVIAAVGAMLASPAAFAQTYDQPPAGRYDAQPTATQRPRASRNNSECASQFGAASNGMFRDNVGAQHPCF